ncbi:MAG: adenylosuccinate lyase family protein [Armatimonadota bacterium]|nr:adenylosuccinate lyase family protein [Armatimonadota bacterium]
MELFDLDALTRDAAASGTPAIPLVQMLTARAGVAARGFVHWGATSQDVIDTALVLQMWDGLDLLERALRQVAGRCAVMADRHRRTLMAGRTLLQHAVPITFGLKAARWLALTTRLIVRLREVRPRALVVQFGGAAGTLAVLGQNGQRVMHELARALGLGVPDLPWHAERDRVAEVAARLGIVAGAMAKVATDIVLLSQTEVGEVSTHEPGAARSSAMPHKRNPAEATNAIAAARLALSVVPALMAGLVQEHERAAGAWQVEWDALPRLFGHTASAVHWVHHALAGMEIDAARMQANLDASCGLIMSEALMTALAPALGRDEAYRLVQHLASQATTQRRPLADVAAADARVRASLSIETMARAFDLSGYLGSTEVFIARALEGYHALPAMETR